MYVQCACAVYTERAVCGNDIARSQSRQMNELPQNIHFTLNLDEMLAGIVCCAPGYVFDGVCVYSLNNAMCTHCVQCVLSVCNVYSLNKCNVYSLNDATSQ